MEIPKLRLKDHYKTLREASFDDENEKVSLIDSGNPAYLLDKITERLCKSWRGGILLASADAYVEKDGRFYFIEFKNQKWNEIDPEDIRKKAFDSISIIRTTLNQEITLEQLCRNAVFLVVFRDDDTSGFLNYKSKLAKLAKRSRSEPLLFGLERIEGSLYADVHTIPKAEFVRRYLSEIWNTPA